MQIVEMFAFLCGPHKGSNPLPAPSGIQVPLSGLLFEHISELFAKSESECNVEVALISDGSQGNPFRDVLLPFVSAAGLSGAEAIALRLCASTTRRSKLGLLFLVRATDNRRTSVLLARFPTDTAILVDETSGALDVKLIDKVFVKNYHAFKAARFSGVPAKGAFWDGFVLDRQLNSHREDASRYWVSDFLCADFKVTSAHGSDRFARAVNDASAGASFEEKRELHSFAGLVGQFDGQAVSPREMLEKLMLSPSVKTRVLSKLNGAAQDQKFKFDRAMFNSVNCFRTIETKEGAIITADSATFEKVISLEVVEKTDSGERVRLTTEGILAADKLRRTK